MSWDSDFPLGKYIRDNKMVLEKLEEIKRESTKIEILGTYKGYLKVKIGEKLYLLREEELENGFIRNT